MPISNARIVYYRRHRLARLGKLRPIAASTSPAVYLWFVREVRDLRVCRRRRHDQAWLPRTFDALRESGIPDRRPIVRRR